MILTGDFYEENNLERKGPIIQLKKIYIFKTLHCFAIENNIFGVAQDDLIFNVKSINKVESTKIFYNTRLKLSILEKDS